MSEKTIKAVLRSEVVKGGHAISITLKLDDGEYLTLECRQENASHLSMAIIDAARLAERARKASPGQVISTEVPYFATDARAGHSPDTGYVVLKCSTNAGPPVTIAMSPELAGKAIEQLTSELEKATRATPIVRQ